MPFTSDLGAGTGAEPAFVAGPQASLSEMRRFAAGLRCITAVLCFLLLSAEWGQDGRVVPVLVAYAVWAGWLLWHEARGRPVPPLLLHFWIDVAWGVLLQQLTAQGISLLALTFVQPVVMASISQGVRHGVLLGLFGAAGLLLDFHAPAGAPVDSTRLLSALGVLGLAPAAALLSSPMRALRQRVALADQLEAETDPRRGLERVCLHLAERLRDETGAAAVALVLPAADAAPAVLAKAQGDASRAQAELHGRLERLLQALPARPLSWEQRHARADLIVLHGDAATPDLAIGAALAALGELLQARSLTVLPLRRLGRVNGHLVVGHTTRDLRSGEWDAAALAQLVPVIDRLLQQAALVDELQAEIASHERARIGRDLHDSAIQPYLGLKYAVESVAAACPPDNPLHPDLSSLAELVQHEVSELRELISVLRTGDSGGDNALLPAVRRQVRRFAHLFGIQVHLDAPAALPTSRALADAVFHMVNEALNNVRKHTPARNVWVQLAVQGTTLHLTVRDDAGSRRGQPADDFAPRSLLERAAELGGDLRVGRAGERSLDTEVIISVPLR